MFEDPSAITRGWQENPVDFDTVFNQSKHVWSWGSPDILPMFAQSAWNGQVRTKTYDSSMEKFFANQDISQLDTWVFDHVQDFLRQPNEELKRSSGVILFLHLLGLDTNGHSNKPNSPEFARNLRIVDQGVKQIVSMCEDFWRHDGRTAYLFTADHGMTDWGSHGAGMDHETQTPFIAWGSGIRSPVDGRSSWPKFSTSRKSIDVNQTDAAPFMASLLGINMPQHSLGKVPLDFLSIHDSDKVEAKLANALQIHQQYLAVKNKRTNAWFQSPSRLGLADPFDVDLEETVKKIRLLKSKAKYSSALLLSDELYEKGLQALFFYQRYHRLPLYLATSLTYVGFIIYILLNLLKDHSSILVFEATASNQALLWIGVIYSTMATFGQNVPYHYFFYYVSPFYVWNEVMSLVQCARLAPNQQAHCRDLLKVFLLALVTVETLVLAFFDRRALSLTLLLQVFIHAKSFSLIDLAWSLMCICLGAFSFQPSVGKSRSPSLVVANAGIATLIACVFVVKLKMTSRSLKVLSGFLAISGLCVVMSNVDKLSFVAHVLSWVIFVSAIPIAFLTKTILVQRLLSLNMAVISIYQLFCLTYEALFLTCLSLTLLCWLLMDHQRHSGVMSLSMVDANTSPR